MRTIKRSIAHARDERERDAREREAREVRERVLLGLTRSLGARDLDAGSLDAGSLDARSLDARSLDSGILDAGRLDASCHHVTRELATRIDLRDPDTSREPHVRTVAERLITDTSLATRETDTPVEVRRRVPRRDVEPLRCEPCPRVLPARRLFDGSLLQQFQCDGACHRDRTRAREREHAHAAQHARWENARAASRRARRTQIAITTVLAAFAAMWIVLAVREASADTRTRRDEADTRTRRDVAESDDDDHAIDVAAPPTRVAPFGAPIVAPPIASVLDAAYRTAGLDHDLGRGFSRRARLAGLVPMLSVRHGRDTSWRDEDPNVSRGMTIDVRATWRLDRLVFDGRELQVAALDGARRRERRRVAARVIQVYFAWKRAAGAAGIQPRAAALAEEAVAELDDLTDGWFSQEQGRLRGR